MDAQTTELSSIKILNGTISPLLRYEDAQVSCAVISTILPIERKP